MIQKNNILSYINISLIVLCSIFFCIYSIDTIDSGFILSFIGRLDAGQILYKDFDIVRPPGSIILWDILLSFIPKNWEYLVIFTRILLLLEILFISYLLYHSFLQKTNKLMIGILFISILHTFPLMPWHTIDGILFGSLAIYSFRKKWFLLGVLFAIISASTKQSYYIFALVFSLISFYFFIKKPLISRMESIYLTILSFFLVFIIWKYRLHETYIEQIQQITSSSNLQQFINAGIKSYFFKRIRYNILFLFFLGIIFYEKKLHIKYYFYISTLLTLLVFYAEIFNHTFFISSNVLLIFLSVLYIKFNKNLPLFFLFALAWCSSLSWGYNKPMFLIIPIYIAMFGNIHTYIHTTISLLILLPVILYQRVLNPYMQQNVFQKDYIFVLDIPVISGIFMEKDTYDYFKETIYLNKKYNNPIFLPANPLGDVITNYYPLRASWEMDVEMVSKNKIPNNHYYIVDKNPIVEFREGFFKSSLTKEIVSSKTKIDSTKFMYIYK